jgi:DNA-binding NtrC family response regulator
MSVRILIVEDQFIEANNLQMILERAGYKVMGIARSVPVAMEMIATERPDFVLLDIFLQGNLTGIDLAARLREQGIAFVYLSANSNRQVLEAAKATRPYGFLVKPFRQKDVLVALEIGQYLHEHRLEAIQKRAAGNTAPDHKARQGAGINKYGSDLPVPGSNSPAMKQVLEQAKLVAPTDVSVLLLGESGTGKEVMADAIHKASARNKAPFVKINCAALPENLIESILFGHEKGAFTGAHEAKTGKFEQANGGTVFLDEIGELNVEVQAKLLRVLQEKEIERVGGHKTIKTDVRIIAATNCNLELAMAEGRFRIDLYYRLNVFPISLPPLRERREDIPDLAKHFLDLHLQKMNRAPITIEAKAMDALCRYHWPGNVRELQHIIERAILLSNGKPIKDFGLQGTSATHTPHQVKTIEENERDHIMAILTMCHGKVSGEDGAAKILGIKVSTLNSRIKKLGITKEHK